MDVAEFRQLGLLQEVNRLFFHPRGLALEVLIDGDGERFGTIWDCRDDAEGVIFGPAPCAEKARTAAELLEGRAGIRLDRFGWVVQPVDQ